MRILGHASIRIGKRVTLRHGVTIGGNGLLAIGDHSTINENVIITATECVSIGSNCVIAPYVYILDVDHKIGSREELIKDSGYLTAPVDIGDDVWIGAQAIIAKGVKIGDGVVIGANSFVNSDIPEFSIAAGNPAKIIGSRQ